MKKKRLETQPLSAQSALDYLDPVMGTCYKCCVRIIARKTLVEFWQKTGCKDAEQPLKAWFQEAREAQWSTPVEIKANFRSASILKNNRVVFNIAGNKYRLVTAINYHAKIVFIRFIGTHAEYDRVNAEEI